MNRTPQSLVWISAAFVNKTVRELTFHGVTAVVPRMQFYAVEIARNRAGLNNWVYDKAQAEKNKK
jgi:hypothetical protein